MVDCIMIVCFTLIRTLTDRSSVCRVNWISAAMEYLVNQVEVDQVRVGQ